MGYLREPKSGLVVAVPPFPAIPIQFFGHEEWPILFSLAGWDSVGRVSWKAHPDSSGEGCSLMAGFPRDPVPGVGFPQLAGIEVDSLR